MRKITSKLLLNFVISFVFITKFITLVTPIRQSYTLSNQRCITDCLSYSYYYFCYYTFHRWDYCEPNKTNPDIQFFTSRTAPNSLKCTSECDFFDNEEYEWCLINGLGKEWDYCSSLKGYSVYGNQCLNECQLNESNIFGCLVRSFSGRQYEPCAPAPIILNASRSQEYFVYQICSDNQTSSGNDLEVDAILIDNNEISLF